MKSGTIIICALLSLLLILSFTSCADPPSNNTSGSSAEATENIPVTAETPDTTNAPSTTGIPAETRQPDLTDAVYQMEGEALLAFATHDVTAFINGEKKPMRARVSILERTDALKVKFLQLELLGVDGTVQDYVRYAGLGFISINDKKGETTEFAVYSIYTKDDKSFSAVVMQCIISDVKANGSKAEKTGFVFLEDNASVNGSVADESSVARWSMDVSHFSSSANKILSSYIGMPVLAYISAEDYGTPKDVKLPYTEAMNEQIAALTIDDITTICEN